MLAYESNELVNKRTRVWLTAAIFPDLCADPEPECLASDGIQMAADATKFARGWTRNGGMLFYEKSAGTQGGILQEYSNPFTGAVGSLKLGPIERDQRDTTY